MTRLQVDRAARRVGWVRRPVRVRVGRRRDATRHVVALPFAHSEPRELRHLSLGGTLEAVALAVVGTAEAVPAADATHTRSRLGLLSSWRTKGVARLGAPATPALQAHGAADEKEKDDNCARHGRAYDDGERRVAAGAARRLLTRAGRIDGLALESGSGGVHGGLGDGLDGDGAAKPLVLHIGGRRLTNGRRGIVRGGGECENESGPYDD